MKDTPNEPVPGVPLPNFKAMDPKAILDRDPETWTSGEATLILGIGLMMFSAYAPIVHGAPNAERALIANVAALAIKAGPRMDPRIIIPWPKVRDLMKKQVENYDVSSQKDDEEDHREEDEAGSEAEGRSPHRF